MRIYFEDGELVSLAELSEKLNADIDFIVDAKYGITHCDCALLTYSKTQPDVAIYTNSIMAFSNEYAWNKNLKRPEICIRNKVGEFVNIANCTTRELKEGHNLAKMYISGEFSHYQEKEGGGFCQVANEIKDGRIVNET